MTRTSLHQHSGDDRRVVTPMDDERGDVVLPADAADVPETFTSDLDLSEAVAPGRAPSPPFQAVVDLPPENRARGGRRWLGRLRSTLVA